MKKRLVALLLAFALCMGLAAGAAAEGENSALDSAAAATQKVALAEAAALSAQKSEKDAADQSTSAEEELTAASTGYFSGQTIYLQLGESASLLAKGAELPEGAVFSASGDAVTVAEDGTASGAAAGSVTVTLSSASGAKLGSVKVICYQVDGYFKQEGYYVKVGGTLTVSLAVSLPEGAKWSAGTPANVSVNSSGKLTGKAIGRSTITLTLPDGTVLDTAEAYAFEPTTWSVTPKKAKSGVLHARTLKTTNKYKSRTYYLFKQQYDSKNHSYLSAHGCSVTAAADILTGYGFTDVDPVWLQKTFIPQVAKDLGIDVGNRLKNRKDGKTLGFYGIQQTLLAMGVTAEIRSAYGDIAGAAEDITKALSEGRPVVLLINKADEEGYPKLCSTWHYLYLSGIDKNGYVLNTCGSSANVQTTNGLNGSTAKVTVTDLLTHYRRSSNKERKIDDDFFINTSKTGSLTYLVCLTAEPGLAENVITASGKSLYVSSKTQSFSLNASVQGGAKLSYQSDSKYVTVDKNGKVTVAKKYAGTATITITSAQTELYQAAQTTVTVKVNRKTNTITGKNRTVTTGTKAQTVSLSCSAKGSAALSYQSDNSQVKVSKKGVVTIPKGFVGQAVITVTSAQTAYYNTASTTFTVKAIPTGTTLSSCTNKSKRKIKVKWKKNSAVDGYQIQYSTSSSFRNASSVNVEGKDTTSKTISGLKKKSYYVRVRTWKKVSETYYWSSWSSSKKVKVKK